MLLRSGGREESARLAGKAVENSFACWDFDETEDTQGEEDQDDVGEPGVQSGEVKSLGYTVGMEKLKDVEVEEVEAVAALANEEERAPGKKRGDGVRAAEAENQGSEDGCQETAVHEEVGGVADEHVEEESDGAKADGGEDEALTRSEGEGELQFAEGDAGEEGADVGERGVLEEADELAGAVAVDGADDVVGVQVEIKGMGNEADDPKGDEEKNELDGFFGPGQADEPREGDIEDAFAGECPGDGVPEGGDRRAPTLEDQRREDDSLPELGVGARMPLILHHADGEHEDEKVDRVKTREAGEPELALAECFGALGVVVGEDVAGDEEEDADKDVAVVDEWIENAEMRRREVEEDDGDSEKGANTGERRKWRLACGRGLRSRRVRLGSLRSGLGFEF